MNARYYVILTNTNGKYLQIVKLCNEISRKYECDIESDYQCIIY